MKHVAQYYVQHCPTRSRLKEIQIVILQMPAKRVRQSDFYSNMFGEGKTASKKTKGYEGYFIFGTKYSRLLEDTKFTKLSDLRMCPQSPPSSQTYYSYL